MQQHQDNSFQQSIDNLVNSFKANVQHLASEYAVHILRDSFGVGSNGAGNTSVARGGSSTLKKGEKRDPKRIETLKKSFVAFVEKHPGLRIEEINKQMSTTTRELALPIKKASDEGLVKTKGQKRATTYPAKA
jgi:hypothetical protein